MSVVGVDEIWTGHTLRGEKVRGVACRDEVGRDERYNSDDGGKNSSEGLHDRVTMRCRCNTRKRLSCAETIIVLDFDRRAASL